MMASMSVKAEARKEESLYHLFLVVIEGSAGDVGVEPDRVRVIVLKCWASMRSLRIREPKLPLALRGRRF